jgi:hypothetical protein
MNEPKFHHMAATRYLLLDTTARWITDQPEPKLQKGRPVKMGIWSEQENMLAEHGHFTDTLPIPANCVARKFLRNMVRPGGFELPTFWFVAVQLNPIS